MYSIVCCYNDYDEYKTNIEEGLYRLLKKYDSQCELIGLNNTTKQYASAAEALNQGCEKACQDILVIVHQDVVINKRCPETIIKYGETLKNEFTLIGAAGKLKDKIYTNIQHGKNSMYAGKYRVKELIEVETVDECFFCLSKETWKRLRFNEKICNGWHLYAVEMCLNIRMNLGKVYVGEFDIYHKSQGVVDFNYLDTMKTLCKKYCKKIGKIRTMCFDCSTNFPYFSIVYKKIRIYFRKIVKGY